ncbi:MAG: hypothetical protein ACE5JI_03925 [Acidobacteriota bacterium]
MACPLVEQFRKGGVSREVRMTAASGLLPLKPYDQVELLFLLTHDRDTEVREAAAASLGGVSHENVQLVVTDRSASPKVLSFFASRVQNAELARAILQNPSTEDKTVEEMVPRLSMDLLELVVINQTRLLRRPSLITALETSPLLNSDQHRRLMELRRDFKLDGQPEVEAPPEAPQPFAPEGLRDYEKGPPEEESPPPTPIEEELAKEEALLNEEEKKKRQSIYERIAKMNPAERMMEGLRGDREARMYLVRDRNRMVYSAVLSNARLTDSEIEAIAAMRSVSPEVLRTIGGKHTWTKRYAIKHELVKNPLTPVEISMRLIANLSSQHLKRLARDRNVPEQVRRQATKLSRMSR